MRCMDGVVDGVLENPRLCHWNHRRSSARAKMGQLSDRAAGDCFDQALCATRIPKTGEILFPEWSVARSWQWRFDWKRAPSDGYRSVHLCCFQRSNWDQMTLNLDTDVALADKIDAVVSVSATNPDLKPLFAITASDHVSRFSDQLVMPETASITTTPSSRSQVAR